MKSLLPNNQYANAALAVDNFQSYDLGACAALVSVGYELISLDKTNPRKVLFIFQNEHGIEQTVKDYWSDKLQVNARSMFDNIRMLKNQIYSE